jgi:hypothetical protein
MNKKIKFRKKRKKFFVINSLRSKKIWKNSNLILSMVKYNQIKHNSLDSTEHVHLLEKICDIQTKVFAVIMEN